MPTPLFSLNDKGQVIPQPPGEPDGRNLMTAEEVCAITGDTPAALLDDWYRIWGPLVARPAAADEPDADRADPGVRLDPGKVETVRADTLRIVHEVFFPGLRDDQDIVDAVAYAQRRNLDVWAGHVWAKRERGEDGEPGRLYIGATIAGLRAVAHRTGLYEGLRATTYAYRRDDPDRLDSATTVVCRRVAGRRARFEGVAFFDELYAGPNPYHDGQPRGWLGKCSRAAALREAFPDELGGLYTPEEMAKAFAGPNRRRQGPRLARQHSAAVEDAADDVTDLTQFEVMLVSEFGVRDGQARAGLVRRLSREFPDHYRQDIGEFYRRAARAIRRAPAAYGLARVPQAADASAG